MRDRSIALRWFRLIAVALLAVPVMAVASEWREMVRAAVPKAASIGPLSGQPPAAKLADADGQVLGYAALTDQVADIKGYSGLPFRILVVVSATGYIRNVQLVQHDEPILKAGIAPRELRAYIARFDGLGAGTDARVDASPSPGVTPIDGITGATITAMSMGAAIMVTAHRVARSRGLPVPSGPEAASQ